VQADLTPADVLERLGVGHGSVREWAADHGAEVRECGDFNDPAVVRWIEEIGPELVVFTGGGLVRDELLAAAGRGVMNCHSGLLPRYRGMDTMDWPLLEGHPHAVGLTVHLMSRGVDEGDLLRLYPFDHRETTIPAMRQRLEAWLPLAMADGVVAFANSEVEPAPQAREDGRQYFRMHPRLRAIAEQRLKAFVGGSE
jgi:methionyl-tRNA formyltransferase